MAILAALIVLAGLWGYRTTLAQPAASVRAKLAVVNVAQVLTECQENLDREKTTREKEREIKAEIARMESDANTIRQELENILKPGSDEYQNQLLKWYNQRALRESYEQGQKQVFAAKTQAWMETLYRNFLAEVEKIARAEGITLTSQPLFATVRCSIIPPALISPPKSWKTWTAPIIRKKLDRKNPLCPYRKMSIYP